MLPVCLFWIVLWLLTWLVNEVTILWVIFELSRDFIDYEDSKCHWCVLLFFGHSYNQSLIPSTDVIQLTLTLKIATTQGSKTIFTDINSPISRPSYPTYLLLRSNLSPSVDCFLLYIRGLFHSRNFSAPVPEFPKWKDYCIARSLERSPGARNLFSWEGQDFIHQVKENQR